MTVRRFGQALAAVAAGLALAGCAVAGVPQPTASSPVATPALPPGGVFLATLDFAYGPAGFSIPAVAKPVGWTDLSELVTVVFAPADGQVVHDYLVANLSGMGCPITSQSSDSIVWQCGNWGGGFTMTSSQAALTLRKQT